MGVLRWKLLFFRIIVRIRYLVFCMSLIVKGISIIDRSWRSFGKLRLVL